MRALHLALIATFLAPATVQAQAPAQTTAQQMLDMAARIRADADRLKDSLTPEDRAQMIQQAEELERDVKDGGWDSVAAYKPEDTLAHRMLTEHDGRLEWLTHTGVCAGYTLETYMSYRDPRASAQKHADCVAAYGHWAEHIHTLTDGGSSAKADAALARYDAAAKRIVATYGPK